MLRNYLIVSFRNVWKSKVFSAINIFGLGIGLAACLLIFQFVSFELSYDKFNENYDRTYRITNDRFQNGKLIQHGTIMYPTIGPVMAKDFPEIELQTRLMPGGTMNIKLEDKIFRDGNAFFVDERFLSVFTYPLLAGDKLTALKDRYSMVITEQSAIKYFGATEDYNQLVGKTLYWGTDNQPYTIKGVCKNIPRNSHLRFDALVSYATLINGEDNDADDSWTWSDMRHYLVLKPGVDYKSLEAKFDGFSDRYFQGDKVSGSVEKFFLQPLRDAHLFSNYEYDVAVTANGKAVWAMLIIAGFILLLAWINYVNLTTSKAIDRAKEVGIRKVMGALKSQLVRQFIFESLIISGFAFILAVLLVQLSQRPFNDIVGGDLSIWKILRSADAITIVTLIGVLLTGVLLAGFYPAFVLSAYQPATVLKGKFQRSSRGQIMRKALVVFQFTSSAALITGTMIVSSQLNFMNNVDLGMNIQNTLVVQPPERSEMDSTLIQRVESYKHAISQINGVSNVATSRRLPGDRLGRNFGMQLTGDPSGTNYTMSVQRVDFSFFDTYGVRLLAGRKFDERDHKVDGNLQNTIVINESVAKLVGINNPEDAVGRELSQPWDDSRHSWTIVGVVADFHQESLKNPMEPIFFRAEYSTYSTTSIKLKSGVDQKQVVAEVEKTFQKFFPGNAFDYFFMEDRYKNQYADDNRFGKVVSIFTVLGIIISCLGLIGLSSHTATQRTKEIGIRKALGASLPSIVSLLSMEFIKLVLVASLLALPIAYFGVKTWLDGYAYRITPGVFLFVTPVLLILIIAAITMSFQVMRTALTNPSETLKYE